MRLRWLGAACFQVDLGGLVVLMDPYLDSRASFNPPPVNVAQLVGVDVVAVTHGHYDHFADAPRLLASSTAVLASSRELCDYAKRGLGLGDDRLVALEPGRRVELKGWWVEATKGVHLDPVEVIRWFLGDFNYTPASRDELRRVYAERFPGEVLRFSSQVPVGPLQGYAFERGGVKLWNLSETKPFEELKEVAQRLRPKVALVSVAGGYEADAALMASWAKPKVVVPHSFDRIFEAQALLGDVEAFKARLAQLEPSVEVLVPKPGEWYSF